MADLKLTNAEIDNIAQYICDELGADKSQVFRPQANQVYLRFTREIEARSIAINDFLHKTNLSRAKTVIKNNWADIPEPVKQVLLAMRDEIISHRGDINE